jgi:hypothetical protein
MNIVLHNDWAGPQEDLSMLFALSDVIDEYYDRPALKIQRTWRQVISDPTHSICIRRIQREFEEMTVE